MGEEEEEERGKGEREIEVGVDKGDSAAVGGPEARHRRVGPR